MLYIEFWKLETLRLMNHETQYVACYYVTNSWTWLMKIITSRWLLLYGSIYIFFMFFISNSLFYMFLLTYMYQNIKYIYILYKKRSRICSQTGSFWKCRSRSCFHSRSPLSLPLPSNTGITNGRIVYYRTPYARMFDIDLGSMLTDFESVESGMIHSWLLKIDFGSMENGMTHSR